MAEDYMTLLNKIKLKIGEYEHYKAKYKLHGLGTDKEDKKEYQRKEIKEHVKDSYKSATKKEFYNKQDTADREKTFVGILAYGDKLKKSLGRLTDRDSRPKDVDDKKILKDYESCLSVYSNALGFADDKLEKLVMVEKRLDRIGKGILDMAEKGKLPTGYENDYLKIAENAIKSAQKVNSASRSISHSLRKSK